MHTLQCVHIYQTSRSNLNITPPHGTRHTAHGTRHTAHAHHYTATPPHLHPLERCAAGWKGERCGQLNLVPTSSAKRSANAAYPPASLPDVSSWGGKPVYDAEEKTWHAYFAEMGNHCGVNVWQSLSMCRHAVSDSVYGPYKPLNQGTCRPKPSTTARVAPCIMPWLGARLPLVWLPVQSLTTWFGCPCNP